VDEAALLFQVGAQDPSAEYLPNRRGAEQRIVDILTAAGVPLDGPLDLPTLPEPLQQQLAPHLAELGRLPSPPRRAPGGLTRLVRICAASSLLTIEAGAGGPTVFVHRWTATELHRRWADRDQVTEAHLRAAEYWQWRVRVWPQNRQRDLDDLLEARYHLLAAGRPDDAAALTEGVCAQLHAWGAWDHEEALIRDTLAHLPSGSDRRLAWIGSLGDIAVGRGRVGEAARRYGQALEIRERLVGADPDNTDYLRDLSVSYERLGDLDRVGGRVGEAARRYFAAVDIRRHLLRQEPERADLAEELGVALSLLVGVSDESKQQEALEEIVSVLTLFEQGGTITPKGTAVLGWAREGRPTPRAPRRRRSGWFRGVLRRGGWR
jgi:tetratricopeptide (TPR) repeat protein